MPFAKGQSGNPAGRPVGSRNRSTCEMHEALEESGLPLIQRLLELAGEGNMGAMRQCLDRLMGKHRPPAVALPSPDSPNYVVAALTEIHRALGAGEIASDEAARLVDFVGRTARVLAAKAVAEIDFADRLARVEEILMALLKADTGRHQREAGVSETAPAAEPERAEPAQPVTRAPGEPGAIDNNNENTMSEADTLDEAVRATLPRRGETVQERPMGSVSASALLISELAQTALAAETDPVMPPLSPPARAA
jgi:hypothetical protein